MTNVTTVPEELTLSIQKETLIAAPIGVAFEALLEQIGPRNETSPGNPMPMKLEAWPGGRWWRDLGEDNGHLWGHVQVIKRPSLLEITGPLFMSYPAISHVLFRLAGEGGRTRLVLKHLAMGQIELAHREGIDPGWTTMCERVRIAAESSSVA
jgi:hypothetical protein